MLGLLSLRRRKSYDSPQQAVMTFSHYSKDLLRPIPNTSGLQIRSNDITETPPLTPPQPLLNPPLKGTDRSTAKGKVKDFFQPPLRRRVVTLIFHSSLFTSPKATIITPPLTPPLKREGDRGGAFCVFRI